jgi:hypothetical protein
MDPRIHRPLKIIAFNADGIWRQRYELTEQLQDLHIDGCVFRDTSKNRITTFVESIVTQKDSETVIEVIKSIPHR